MERCIFLLAVVASCCLTNGQTYHYDRPQIPFDLPATSHGHNPQSNYATAPFSTVVRTHGPGGRNYNVLVMGSQQVYEQRQVTPAAPGYQQQTQYAAPYTPRGADAYYTNAQVGQNRFTYNAGVQQNSVGLGGQQYTSTNSNPLTQGGQAQATKINYQASQQYQQLPNAQFGGGTGSNYAVSGSQQLTGRTGDYVSQSEVGQLDAYAHKQQTGDTRAFTRLITTCYPNGQCERRQLGPGQADPRHQHVVMATRARTQPVSDKCQRIAAAQAPRPQQPSPQSYPSSGQSQSQAQAGAAANYNVPLQPVYSSGYPASIQAPVPLRPNNRRLNPYTEVPQPVEPFN